MGERGHFAGRSLGSAFFFTYLDNNWSKVGPDLTSRPAALNVFVFYVPISGRRGFKVRDRCGSWVWSDRPLEFSGPSGVVPNRLRLCVGPSEMRSTGSCSLVCACPPALEVMVVTLRVSPPSGVFSATTFLQEILWLLSASLVLPMIISLSLPLSAVFGRTRILLPLKIDHVHRKGLRVHLHFLKFQSSFVNGRLNLSTEYITIISGMRKGVMPLAVCMTFQLVGGGWDSVIYFNVAIFE
jgi:hypothetical protein